MVYESRQITAFSRVYHFCLAHVEEINVGKFFMSSDCLDGAFFAETVKILYL